MERVVEFVGKKVQDAVDEGLKALGITLDDADIKILSNGGLFKKAKVAITYDDGLKEGEQLKPKKEEKTVVQSVAEESEKPQEKKQEKKKSAPADKQTVAPENEPHWGSAPVKREPTTTSGFGKSAAKESEKREPEKSAEAHEEHKPAKQPKEHNEPKKAKEHNKKPRESALPTEEQMVFAQEFLTELLAKMKIEGKVEIVVSDGMRVNVETEDSRIIGHRGEVLDALQQLISSQINTSHGSFVHVTVDGLGYRDRRKETLENLARRMADKAARTHRKVTLDPMNSADRRIIHAALGEREDVFTRSEGHDPGRRVAIIPKRK